MRYHDERNIASSLTDARNSAYLENPDELAVKYQELVVSSEAQRNRLTELETEVQKRTAAYNATKKEAASLKHRNEQLNADVANLSDALYRLRHSWRLRVGRTLTAPARPIGQLIRKLGSMGRSSSRRPDAKTGSRSGQAPVRSSASLTAVAGVEDQYQLLKEAVAAAPTMDNVVKLLQHCYFTLGRIRETAHLAAEHADLLVDVDPRVARTIRVANGLNRLYGAAPVIPPRQVNAGYVVEQGRVMYCAHSTASFNSNGYSTRTSGITRGLNNNGIDLVVAARPGYPWDVATDRGAPEEKRFEETIHGVSHIYSPGPSWTNEGIDHYFQQAADAYVREAIRHRVSKIHAASNYVTAYPALVASRRLGIPFVYEVRGLWEITEASTKEGWDSTERFAFSKQMESFLVQQADRILAITPQVADELVKRGADRELIEILPNAVDENEFSPLLPDEQLRNELGIPNNAIVMGYAGSLVAYEGVDDLLEALSLISTETEDIRLVIVGDGGALPGLKETANRLGIEDRVIFTGRVAPQKVPAYISIFDIMPCPRLSRAVTTLVPPLKPMEAMASGKAVILSDLPPLVDIAGASDERALTFAAGNVSALAEAIIRLARDGQLRTDLGRRSRQWIMRERTWNAISEIAIEAYQCVQGQAHRVIAAEAKELHDLTVGLIADEFTTEGLAPDTNIVQLTPADWHVQLREHPIDVLIVESAWDGKDGQWRGKVGYYDDESFSTLRSIIEYCERANVPTIFWNKEDPVHFKRFVATAGHFQHVFTTDAQCIRQYLEQTGQSVQSVSSLPFYAQPALHQPTPSKRPYEHTAAYAGSYYGDRYAHRSEQLRQLLSAAAQTGLTIYDRQHLNPDSPYSFPPNLSRYVAGGLDYLEMVQAYKAHPVQINVNSVEDSPTMFSRRVMEAAACGAAVLSGPGSGVEEVFDGKIATISSEKDADLLLTHWLRREEKRKQDAWLAMRTVFRAHTAAHRLTYMLRTAGLNVAAPSLPAYAVLVDDLTDQLLENLAGQSVPPVLILHWGADKTSLGGPKIPIAAASPEQLNRLRQEGIGWAGRLPSSDIDRTYFEDLLTAHAYGPWDAVTLGEDGADHVGRALATPSPLRAEQPGIVPVASLQFTDNGMLETWVNGRTIRENALALTRSMTIDDSRGSSIDVRVVPMNIVVAGHDLKFAGAIIDDLRRQGHHVVIDRWEGHNQHDEAFSRSILETADVIFCEWALGNVAWYSQHKKPHQRLVVRFHLQELFTVYPRQLKFDAIDEIIFVGVNIRDNAIRKFNFDPDRCKVIPNYVRNVELDREKGPQARFNIGIVGIVPERKRLDQALDLLAALRSTDDRFQLFIKGKQPHDYPWMADRPEEMDFYERQYRRITEDSRLQGAVFFDGHSDDMASWYQKIGVVLSVSDFESFHLTLADGAASGALPATLSWAGADQIYPLTWIRPDLDSLTDYVLQSAVDVGMWNTLRSEARAFAVDTFGQSKVTGQLVQLITNRVNIPGARTIPGAAPARV